MTKQLSELLSSKGLKEANKWCAKYPSEERQSAVMQVLTITQDEHGYLTKELMNSVAQYLEMPNIAVYEVATFYSMYEHKACGKHKVEVCTNISCKLRGAEDVVNHLKEVLAVEVGQTTKDNKFTLRTVECLGACVNAPMMQIGDAYHENLDPEKIDEIIAQYSDLEPN